MSKTSLQILEMLADGNPLSGEFMGQALGISRMAVSKAIKGLTQRGLEITSNPGRGYQLVSPLQLLDGLTISRQLEKVTGGNFRLEILHEVNSTSDYLLEQAKTRDIHRLICLAERQAGGRGRRQRKWHSSAYRNIILSMGWRFDEGMAGLSGLGIATGISIVRALHEAGYDREIGLKWPNDIVFNDSKLGGLLIDVRGEHDGPCMAILGFGLNLSLSNAELQSIDQPVTTLEKISSTPPERNKIITEIIHALMNLFESYPETGFTYWQQQWQNYDRLFGRQVNVIKSDTSFAGVAMGIDNLGALQLKDHNDQVASFYSGDVSLRLAR